MNAVVQSLGLIEPMSEEDLDQVMEIEQRVYEFPWTCGNFLDSLSAGYTCLVSRRQGRLIGYAVMMMGPGEAHLLNLSIDAAEQRRGHGSHLLRNLIRIACERGAQQLFLEVRPSNEPARLLYAKHGFRQVGVRPGYYPAGAGREDALVLAFDLEG